MLIFDLGCGTNKEQGSIGIDRVPLLGVDLVIDLQTFPYPLADNIVDKIILNDVIEHLPDTITVMEELYRICKPGARLNIRVVNWNSHYAFEDPTHMKVFTEHSFDFYGKYKLRSYYSKARFDVLKCEYQYNEKVLKKLKSKKILKFLSNYLNNILEGLHFELAAKKSKDTQLTPTEYVHDDIFEIIRCPHCLRDKSIYSKLSVINEYWLVCSNVACQWKFPVINGTPILLNKVGMKWSNIPINSLPTPCVNPDNYTISYIS